MKGFAIDPQAKLTIIPLEGPDDGKSIVAQFNPKELQNDLQATWKTSTNGLSSVHGAIFEYEVTQPSAISFELLFDCFEIPGATVEPRLERLRNLLRPIQIERRIRRPPRVSVIWGNHAGPSMMSMIGVVESASIKYTMFSPSGRAVRATANIKVKEVNALCEKENVAMPAR